MCDTQQDLSRGHITPWRQTHGYSALPQTTANRSNKKKRKKIKKTMKRDRKEKKKSLKNLVKKLRYSEGRCGCKSKGNIKHKKKRKNSCKNHQHFNLWGKNAVEKGGKEELNPSTSHFLRCIRLCMHCSSLKKAIIY